MREKKCSTPHAKGQTLSRSGISRICIQFEIDLHVLEFTGIENNRIHADILIVHILYNIQEVYTIFDTMT